MSCKRYITATWVPRARASSTAVMQLSWRVLASGTLLSSSWCTSLITCMFSSSSLSEKVMFVALILTDVSPLQSAGASCEGHADPALPPAGDRWVDSLWALPHREAADPWAVDPRGQGHPSSLWCRSTPRGPASVPGWTLEPVSPTADPAPGLRSVD